MEKQSEQVGPHGQSAQGLWVARGASGIGRGGVIKDGVSGSTWNIHKNNLKNMQRKFAK